MTRHEWRWAPLAVGFAITIACADERGRSSAFGSAGSIGTVGPGSATASNDGDPSDADTDASTGESSTTGSEPGTTGGGSQPTSGPVTGHDGGSTGDPSSGNPVLDACLDIAMTPCEMCGCNLCLDPLYACEQDPGCVAMRNCAQQTGCVGTDCLEPCGDVIDMYGGPFGASGGLALALSDCLSASCPACF